MLTIPVLLIFIAGATASLYFDVTIIGFIVSFILTGLYWSVMVTRWRIWAFTNVRNVHDLYARAVDDKLILPSPFFAKIEFRTPTQREILDDLEKKFALPDIFIDDTAIPEETRIYYSRGTNFFKMALMLGLLGIGIALLSNMYLLAGTLVTVFSAYIAVMEYRKATNSEAQLILSNNGIQTTGGEVLPWDMIEDEMIYTISGKHAQTYLIFHPVDCAEPEKVLLDDFAPPPHSYYDLLRVYRGRATKQKAR